MTSKPKEMRGPVGPLVLFKRDGQEASQSLNKLRDLAHNVVNQVKGQEMHVNELPDEYLKEVERFFVGNEVGCAASVACNQDADCM